MTLYRHREEALNAHLALALAQFGLDADAETIQAGGRERPDVLFPWRGLRVVIEGKFADHPNAQDAVFADAQGRVQRGVAHLAVAAVYPAALRETPTPQLPEQLATAALTYRVLALDEVSPWFSGTPAAILDALRRAQAALMQDDVIARIAASLGQRISDTTLLWQGETGTCGRLAILLGLPEVSGETPEQAAARRIAAAKIAALIMANALIFQSQLSKMDSRVLSMVQLAAKPNRLFDMQEHWRWIWQNINYAPIFQLGEQVLLCLCSSPWLYRALGSLIAEIEQIEQNPSALRHDLMGRIYHWLLHDAKYLGAYYTSVPAATLLLKLALNRPWPQDFGDPAQLADFKVADLACGTGTLLMASAEALTDAHILARATTQRRLQSADLQALHRILMEDVLQGYDVLPTAVHLTASTLALLAPEVTFHHMNLYVMPMGLDHNTPRLGSLDFLGRDAVRTQITLDQSQAEIRQTDAGQVQITSARLPKLDLCVMNPPFVRSVNNNLLFGSLPDERGVLQNELRKRVKPLSASITAGLGAVFVALADQSLKPGGRLAFILPHALASGEAWGPTRQLLADRYHLEVVISSYDAQRPNFSENTELSEIMFIARKRQNGEALQATTYINLWRNPANVFEALGVAEWMKIGAEGVINLLSGVFGEAFTVAAAQGEEHWYGAMFARRELAQTFLALQQGQVALPARRQAVTLCAIQDLGQLGYDARDIHDAFTVSDQVWSLYPAFWNHDSEAVRTVQQSVNAWLHPRTQAAPKRPLKDAQKVWETAADFLLAWRIRANTQRVLAISLDQSVIGNTWWTFRTDLTPQRRKALLLWLNGSLALLAFFGSRVVTQGAWMQVKKPAWATMPVLDVRALSNRQATRLAAAYDALCTQELQALARLNGDPVRQAIDDALCQTLNLPDLKPLREMLAHEPGLTGQPIAIPPPKGRKRPLKPR